MFPSNEWGSLRRGRFRYLPVVPGRMEFAEEVRLAVLQDRPQVVAVELPSTLESAFLRAVGRLPELSVILYASGNKESIYIPVEITDSFVEAIRSAQEAGAEVFFVDPDVGERPHLNDLYPDTYAVRRLGYSKYVEHYRLCPQSRSFDLERHASGIAWKLQSCDPLAEVLVVISLNLLDPVLDAMQEPQAEPLATVRREEIQVLNLHPDCLGEILQEFPFLQSVYESRRYGADTQMEESNAVVTNFGALKLIEQSPQDPHLDLERIVFRTAKRVDLRKFSEPVTSSSDRLQSAGTNPKPVDEISDPEQIENGIVVPTPPERFRLMDRQQLAFRLFAEAERRYEKNTREKVTHWQRRSYAKYSRNLALLGKSLVPGLFDQTVAARSIVDDNFAWELWDLGSSHLHQKTSSDLVTVNISGEELFLNMQRIRLRRRLPREKARAKPLGLKGRKKEKAPGEWLKQFNGEGICSYPPEDIVLENYGLFLKKKGKSILSEERSHTEPFTTSLLDGVDIRETLRNWHEGKLYVREFQKVSGEVGAVVVIFDEDPEDRYSWRMTWLGEHSQESDMAFYSTDPYNQIVGPGITRAEYGGFLLSYPPRRLMNVWQDPDYWFAESKSETLLLAALDYTLERFVVYVAARPPRSVFKTVASRLGRKIIYIPVGQLSPISLKKIRAVHILDGHNKRPIAKDYIW